MHTQVQPLPLALAGLLLLATLVSCAGAAPRAPRPEPPLRKVGGTGGLAEVLETLGEQALARGEAAVAADRFSRALRANPESARARAGLARLALARGDTARAAGLLAEAEQRAPDDAGVRVAQAELARVRDDPDGERRQLVAALARDPSLHAVHARLLALTGRAARSAPESDAAALELGLEHPYDPRARLRSGRALARAGRQAEALAMLEQALWVADRDYDAALRALGDLGRLSPAWRGLGAVPVHGFADAGVRSDPAWEMRLRLLLRSLNQELRETLGVLFLPAGFGGFEAGSDRRLAVIAESFARQHPLLPPNGVVVAFTALPVPRTRGPSRRGQAELLGRRALVRLEPGQVRSRVLTHELLHLYGGIHVVDRVDSIMNPTGQGRELDRLNRRIVTTLRTRRFTSGGIEQSVLPWIDVEATTAAYLDALRVNLVFRRLGLAEALERGRMSRIHAAALAQEAQALDPHLADVAHFVGRLLVHQRRLAEASILFDRASLLYGPRTPRGRRARADADRMLQLGRQLTPP